jgi:hypothetical protein
MTDAVDFIVNLLGVLFLLALALCGIAGLLWVLEVGKAASWSLLAVFYPLFAWLAALAGVLGLAVVSDTWGLIRRAMARRKALRAALKGDL